MPKPMEPAQIFSLWTAHLLAITALILVLVWALANQDDDYFLGGLSFSGTNLFNWHPILMVAGLVVFYTQGLLAYRTLPLSKARNKLLHNIYMFTAVVLISLGLWAVFEYHNEELYANLYSMHSWAGIVVVTLFYTNYVGGFLIFFLGMTPEWCKEVYMPRHQFIGTFVYIAAAFTAVIGIQEKNSSLGCGYNYTLTEPDYNPAAHYLDIYLGCRVSNGLGIVIILTCLLASYAVADLRVKTREEQPLQNPLL